MITLTNVSQIRVTTGFGWIPDAPDTGKDLHLAKDSKLLSLGAVVQDEMDISSYFRPVSDQMQFPSCTANAAVDAAESVLIVGKVFGSNIALDKAVNTTPDLSRMFAWFNGRQLMDPPCGYDATRGCHNRLVLNGMLRHGICTETRWPYTAPNASTRPSIMSYREAFAHMYSGFYAIQEDGDARKNLILQALAAKHSVIFGTDLDDQFMGYRNGVLHRPQQTIRGRHALVIVGWSRTKSAFKVRNSWSRYWGDQGHVWMHTDYIIDYAGTKAFWVLSQGGL